MPKFIDRTGQRIGQLTVIHRVIKENDKRTYWKCSCSCGKDIIIRADLLKEDGKGNPSCGCLRTIHLRETIQKIKPNDKFFRLTVLEWDSKKSKWKCKCDCGNTTYVPTYSLLKGSTKSCGCYQKEIARKTGSKSAREKGIKENTYENGFYIMKTELRPTNTGKNEIWCYSICPFCGNKKWIKGHYIRDLTTKSCGCISYSAGEQKIKKILNENNISFIQEKIFEDCKDKLPLRFDFFIENKYIIEFDGIQHFKKEAFHNASEEEIDKRFNRIKKHDLMKNEWCYKNNIPLIRIPYTHYKELSLKDLLLETSSYII